MSNLFVAESVWRLYERTNGENGIRLYQRRPRAASECFIEQHVVLVVLAAVESRFKTFGSRMTSSKCPWQQFAQKSAANEDEVGTAAIAARNNNKST